MNDRTKMFIVRTILLNDRLKAYTEYINEARQQGYKVETLAEFHNHYTEAGKHFVLRHDVDHRGKATRKMFECEKELGVKSTYFFRKSTVDKALIDEMIQAGFEVGFHFETIANYIEENHITTKSNIDLKECEKKLKNEIDEFEKMIGHKIHSLCSHGAPANVKLGISSNAITEDGIPEGIAIDYEAYDKDMYDYVDCHIMDGSILFNYGFSYKDTPKSAMTESKRNIVFLSHPHHWYLSGIQRILQLRAFILGKSIYSSSRSFIRVEQ